MRFIVVFLIGVVAFADGVVAQADQPKSELPDELARAIADLETRDRHVFAKVKFELKSYPDRARRRLRAHAKYLATLDEAAKLFPEKYRLLLEQEKHEQTARRFVQRYLTALSKDAGDETDRLVNDLRGCLRVWFSTRQALRREELRIFEQSIDDRAALVDGWRDGPMARGRVWREWLQKQKLSYLEQKAANLKRDFRGLAIRPALYQIGRNVRLTHPHHLRGPENRDAQTIHAIPQGPDQSRAYPTMIRGKEVDGRLARKLVKLVSAVIASRETDADARETGAAIQAALPAVIEAEIAIADEDLVFAREQIERRRATIDTRDAQQGMIIDLEMSRLLGDHERFAW